MKILDLLQYTYSSEDITACEVEILQNHLNFMIPKPTYQSISKLVLFICNSSFDFTVLLEQIEPIQHFIMLESQFQLNKNTYCIFSLAIASLYFALEQLMWFGFKDQFKEYLNSQIIDNCVSSIPKLSSEEHDELKKDILKQIDVAYHHIQKCMDP